MGSMLTKEFLDELYERHHRLGNLFPDPLVYARGYDDPKEGEVAGLIAASLAYGRVEKIVEALGFVFERLGPRPRATLLAIGPKELSKKFEGFVYRFHKGADIALFLWLVRGALARWGGLGELFSASRDGDMGRTLTEFSAGISRQDPRPFLSGGELPKGHPVRFLVASPASGCAAKRLCLYLRWMVRKDELDPGYWAGMVDPASLVVPLDTHVAKVGRTLGMTARKAADWRTALEITDRLRAFYPNDPLRADFSLFRFGMKDLKEWQKVT